jgi:hypothetical protein
MTMTTLIALSIVASIVGVFALIRGRRKIIAASGATLVFAAIAVLVWTRPSMARLAHQHDAIASVCSRAATQFEIFELRHRGDDPLMPPPPPWSAELPNWKHLVTLVEIIEPICFPYSERACLSYVSPDSYDEAKPEADRIIRTLRTHTACWPATTP